MTARTPFTVRVRSLVEGPPDEFGVPTETWVERDWRASAIAPGAQQSSAEPDGNNRDLNIVMWTVYGPVDGAPTSHLDQVRLPGQAEWLPVEGTPKNWTMGPFGTHPIAGMVVALRRADG